MNGKVYENGVKKDNYDLYLLNIILYIYCYISFLFFQ